MNRFACKILSIYDYAHRSDNCLCEPGKGKTAFLTTLGALHVGNYRINENNLLDRIFSCRAVNYDDLSQDADLWCGRPTPPPTYMVSNISSISCRRTTVSNSTTGSQGVSSRLSGYKMMSRIINNALSWRALSASMVAAYQGQELSRKMVERIQIPPSAPMITIGWLNAAVTMAPYLAQLQSPSCSRAYAS